MDPQYIYDDSTSPPTESVLRYSVNPDTVYVSTDEQTMYADLTITVFNPQDEAVTCQAFQFGFLVGALYGDLTADDSGIQTSSDQTEWAISKQASEDPDNPNQYDYTVTPSTNGVQTLTLASYESLYFHLGGVEINQADAGSPPGGEGVVPIFIKELTGANPNDPQIVDGQIAISKDTGELAVNSFGPTEAGPFDPGAIVTLSWSLMGSDRWQLFDAGTLIYDSETSSPPGESSYTVQPTENTTYELLAFAGELFVAQAADVMVRAARFVTEPYAEPSEVSYDQASTLRWQTQYASKLVIAAPGFQTVVLTAPPGQYDLFLQAPDNQLEVPPSTYTLTAYGPGDSQATSQVPILLAIPPPAINTFTATPQVFNAGGSVDLAWGTSYGIIALLSQTALGSNAAAIPQIVATNSSEYAGSVYPVNPVGISYYTLLLRGQGDNQAISEPVMVVGNMGTYSVGQLPIDLASDGTHIWVIFNMSNQVIVLNAGDGAPGGSGTIESTVSALAFDGTNIWAAFTDGNGNGYVAILQVVGNSIVAGQSYPLGITSPATLTYDYVNKCLWATGQGSDSYQVCKLQVSDGTVLGKFDVGDEPDSILFDGARIWVLNFADGDLTVLNASDGSPVGTPPLANNPVTLENNPQALTFDGTYLWIGLGDNTVTVLRPDTGAQVCPPVDVGGTPYALAFDGTNIWVAQSSGVTILRMIKGAAEVVIPSFPVGNYPIGLAFDGNHMWAINYRDGTVRKL
jgi:hypothetical protein